jgi:serine/threonine protein kinase
LLGRKIERYFVVGKLGEGGMGAVYLAWQEPLGREVALKLISGLELTNEVKARFEREARAISVLDHPNIVKLYDYGIANIGFELPFMALEKVIDDPCYFSTRCPWLSSAFYVGFFHGSVHNNDMNEDLGHGVRCVRRAQQ